MDKLFVSFIAVFLITAIAVGSAGYMPEGYTILNVVVGDVNADGVVNQTDFDLCGSDDVGATVGIFYLLPENYTKEGDLDMDGQLRRDKEDLATLRVLRSLQPIYFGEDAYIVAADVTQDGVIDMVDIRHVKALLGRSTGGMIQTYVVGDHNGDGVVLWDVSDLWATYRMARGMTPYSVIGDFDLDGVVDMNDMGEHISTYIGRIPEVTRAV